ncbi:hypothetical protein NUW54_g10703 [Trametes sanguinea]|uniref:Uncharacterized protein n=1 Tax=Trametes sanguinea TaxID=158606 RepID=A0ACC1NV60_9APHY|nr:hypothetical protein NUW54_g10703 [Trametes sanguinea]
MLGTTDRVAFTQEGRIVPEGMRMMDGAAACASRALRDDTPVGTVTVDESFPARCSCTTSNTPVAVLPVA